MKGSVFVNNFSEIFMEIILSNCHIPHKTDIVSAKIHRLCKKACSEMLKITCKSYQCFRVREHRKGLVNVCTGPLADVLGTFFLDM